MMLGLALVFSFMGKVNVHHAERLEVISIYWHFVDAVWIVVFTVVYFIGR
jgi:cytochrome c oxidase subunit 3